MAERDIEWRDDWVSEPVPPHGPAASAATIRNLRVEAARLRHVVRHLRGLVLDAVQADAVPTAFAREVLRRTELVMRSEAPDA